ncbi:MAG: GNAT family N-acetyltransferase [Rubrivivax sp.]
MNADGGVATRYPVALIRPLTLRDGRRVLLRPVLPQDTATEQAFVMGLSAASRYRRFHVGLRALPPSLLRQMTQIDHDTHVALVAQPEVPGDDGDDDPGIVADARYVRSDDGTAEFAVAVADGWQQLGLGRQMLEQLARHAARHGVHTLVGDVLVDNLPMITMLQRMHCELQLREDEPGLLLATIRL